MLKVSQALADMLLGMIEAAPAADPALEGLSSSFLHLSKIEVEAGTFVRQGDLIGRVGATGRASGPHLDWRMNWLDRRVNPQLLLTPIDTH